MNTHTHTCAHVCMNTLHVTHGLPDARGCDRGRSGGALRVLCTACCRPPPVPRLAAGSAARRQRLVLSLLRACREAETKFIVRTLIQASPGGPAWNLSVWPARVLGCCRNTAHLDAALPGPNCPQALRVGANWRSVIPAIGRAVLLHSEGARAPKVRCLSTHPPIQQPASRC